MFTDPGTISSDYLKYFDLLKNIDKNNVGDTGTKNTIEKLIHKRNSCDLTNEDGGDKLKMGRENNSNLNIAKNMNDENNLNSIYNLKKENSEYLENEHLLNQTVQVENQPITIDSFHKLFNTDLNIVNNNFDNSKNLENSKNGENRKNEETTLPGNEFFKSKEFFFKFLYYTREMSLEKMIKNRNFCVYCKIIRPERSHHCKECRKCILRMDHHCGILNTCVGYYNYKPWVTFVFYSTAHLFLILATMIDGLGFYFDSSYYGRGTYQCNIFLLTFVIIVIAFLSVGELFVTHLLYIMKGVTTIEDKSQNFFDQLVKSQNGSRGISDHIDEAMGSSACNWFYPSRKSFSVYDGYAWLNGKSYEEFINERRMAYLKSLDGDVPIYSFIDKSDISFSENNYSNFNDSIRGPL